MDKSDKRADVNPTLHAAALCAETLLDNDQFAATTRCGGKPRRFRDAEEQGLAPELMAKVAVIVYRQLFG